MTVEKTSVAQIMGEDRVEGVLLADGRTLSFDGVFVALGSAGAVDLARRLGLRSAGIVWWWTRTWPLPFPEFMLQAIAPADCFRWQRRWREAPKRH